MLRNGMAVIAGAATFAVGAMMIGALRCRLYALGAQEGGISWAVALVHIGLPMFASGAVVGAIARSRPFAWSLVVPALYASGCLCVYRAMPCVWQSVCGSPSVSAIAPVIVSVAAVASCCGAALGRRLRARCQ